MWLCMQKTKIYKGATRLISEFFKSWDTRSTHKKRLSIYVLAMNNWKLKLKKMPFTIASKNMKCIGINLTKYKRDLYNKSYKTLMREIKDLNKWRDILCSWSEVPTVSISMLSPQLIEIKCYPNQNLRKLLY